MIKLGSTVRIVNHYIHDPKYNPRHTNGTVVSLEGKYNPIEVVWPNGVKNSYSEKSLEIV